MQTNTTGETIKALRKGRFTQRGLAKLAGLWAPRLCLIEAGKARPRFDEVQRLARALGVSADDLGGHAPTLPPEQLAATG